MNEPNTRVEIITSDKTEVTNTSYSENTEKALRAKPSAIAPLIMPAYDKKTSSLNLKVFSHPHKTKEYCTMITDSSLPTIMMTNSYPMKVKDQSEVL